MSFPLFFSCHIVVLSHVIVWRCPRGLKWNRDNMLDVVTGLCDMNRLFVRQGLTTQSSFVPSANKTRGQAFRLLAKPNVSIRQFYIYDESAFLLVLWTRPMSRHPLFWCFVVWLVIRISFLFHSMWKAKLVELELLIYGYASYYNLGNLEKNFVYTNISRALI